MASARPGDAIEAALREVAKHLEANEVIAAASAVQRLGAACNAATSAGSDDLTRARLAPLVEHCTALAAKSNTKLALVLARFGTGKRAYRAYSAD